MTRNASIVRSILLATALAVGGTLVALAGPLDPPAGPIAPTFKTLTEVEPRIAINLTNTPGDTDSLFKITQPGSYYLTGNLTGVSGKHGVEIAADNVTIDLMGFKLAGVAGALAGVAVPSTTIGHHAVIRNGHVSGWSQGGVFTNATLRGCCIEQVVASANVGRGIIVGGGGRAVRCISRDNTGSLGTGFTFGLNTKAEDCIAIGNSGAGFLISGAAEVLDCIAVQNGSDGFLSNSGNETLYVNCVGSQNTGDGFSSAGDAFVACRAEQNDQSGFFGSGRFTDCTAFNNHQNGFFTTGNSFFTGCFARANASSNVDDGAGFRISGAGSRVESCSAIDNDRGFEVVGPNNFLIKNSAQGNGGFGSPDNYIIGANNSFGPLVNVTAVGNMAGVANANHPWANFGY